MMIFDSNSPFVPSLSLPVAKNIRNLSAATATPLVRNLERLYGHAPASLPSGYITPRTAVDSGYATDDDYEAKTKTHAPSAHLEDLDAWSIARADTFEREHAFNWMTRFLAQSEEWVEDAAISDSETGSTSSECTSREDLVRRLSSLLASSVEITESGALDREFTFFRGESTDPSALLRVVLRDEDLGVTDHTNVGLQTWGSAVVMIEKMARELSLYGLDVDSLNARDQERADERRREFRILELGAGTGLLSLAIGTLLNESGTAGLPDDLDVTIVATDYHPDVLANLRNNVDMNPSASSPRVSIVVAPLDWQLIHDRSDDVQLGSPFIEPFDLILAADCVYRPLHAQWLASTVRALLRRPTDSSSCRHESAFHLIQARRPTHVHTWTWIQDAFEPSEHLGEIPSIPSKAVSRAVLDEPSRSLRMSTGKLQIVGFEDTERTKSIGRADESAYRDYKIKWV